MTYLIQTTIYTGVFWLLYRLVLRDRPMHQFNRLYLLVAFLLPFILPFVMLPDRVVRPAVRSAVGIRIPEITIAPATGGMPVRTLLSPVLWSYGIVCFFLLCRLAYQLYSFYRLLSQYPREDHRFFSIVRGTGIGPASRYRFILLPGETADARIIRHEAAHVRRMHSLDLDLCSLLLVAGWYNPFLYLLRRELRVVHEYQADLEAGYGDSDYGELLVRQSFGLCTLPIVHSFFHHPLKRRIMMLQKKKDPRSVLLAGSCTALLSALFISAAVMVQSCGQKEWVLSPEEKTAAKADTVVNFGDVKFTEIKDRAEQMPSFPGGNEALTGFLQKHLSYPAAAQAKGIQGRVIVQFFVDEAGALRDISVLKSPDRSLSEAAIDVVSKMPRWEPGRDAAGKPVAVKFVLPVSFRL